MKKILTLMSVAAMLFFTACEDDNTPYVDKPLEKPTEEIAVTATTIKQKTRVAMGEDAVTSIWTDGDKISLFANYKDSWKKAGEYDLVSGSQSDDKRTADFVGKFIWEDYRMPHMFYGFATKDVDPEMDVETAIPTSLPLVQKQNGAGVDALADYNFMIARPAEYTAPLDPEDPNVDKKIALEFQSIYSMVEFRFAVYQKEGAPTGMKIKKVTFESDKYDLLSVDGTVDITKAYFDTDFGKVVGGTRSKKATLEISNPLPVPSTRKMAFIANNSSIKPADLDVVFPARFVVLPNSSQGATEEEIRNVKWTVSILAELPGLQNGTDTVITRTVDARVLKPGERHAVPCVTMIGGEVIPGTIPDKEGVAWTGDVVKPTIDHTTKIITIEKPSELAWVRDIANGKRPVTEAAPATRTFADYTINIVANLNLGNILWEPIGTSNQKNEVFAATVIGIPTAEAAAEQKTKVYINGLNVDPTIGTAYTYLGLFGYASSPKIEHLKVDGKVNASYAVSSSATSTLQVGGIMGQSIGVNFYDCEFNGVISGIINGPLGFGGIVGYPSSGSITLCSSGATLNLTNNSTNVTSLGMAGGIAGGALSAHPSVTACSFDGVLNLKGQWQGGGIIGRVGAKITACKNTGTIICDGPNDQIGGIVGSASANIIACYNRGNISITDGASRANTPGVGGIVGLLYTGSTIKGCYNTGRVDAALNIVPYAGNIVGTYAYILPPFDYSKVINNFHLYQELNGDLDEGLNAGAIYRFSPSAWPNPEEDGWYLKNSGKEDAYWHDDFPASYGVGEYEYPYLYWEVIY